MEAVLFIGIPATGKSTFFKARFVDSHIRINLDMLRTRHRERLLVDACLEAKQSFVVDNTNPSRGDRARYVGPAKDAGFQVIGYYFRSVISESSARNMTREGSARVPDEALRGIAGKLEQPEYDEGFDALYYVRIEDGEFSVQPWTDDGT